jgi:O-antigen ligase
MSGFGLGPVVLWTLYLTVMGAVVISALRRPEIGLYVLIPLLPNETLRAKLHGFLLADQFIDLLMLGIAVGLFLRGQRIFASSALRKVVFTLWILTFVTLWTGSLLNDLPLPAPFSDIRFSDWKNYCRIAFLLFLAQQTIQTRKQMLLVVVLMCIGMLWVERSFILSNRGRTFDTFSYTKRDPATMVSAGENGLAAFLAQNALFILAFALSQEKVRRWAFTFLGLATTACMVMVFSRGAYLAFAIGFIALGIFKRRGLVFATIAFLIVSLAIGATIIPGAVIERITMTQQANGELEASAAGRLIMWDLVMGLFKQHPWFGAGFDTVKFLVHYEGLADAHNYYIQLLGEMGVAGFSVFLWLLGTALASSWRLFRRANDPMLMSIGLGSLVCVICIAIGNCFGNRWGYIEISGYTFIMFGMVYRGLNMVEEEAEAYPEPTELPALEQAAPELVN